jgi:PAS domain S-box-containing protein
MKEDMDTQHAFSKDPFHHDIILKTLQSTLNVNDYISVLDRDCTYRYVNLAYKKYFNLDEADILGKTHKELFGAEFYKKTIRPNLEKCLQGESVHYSAWYKHNEIQRYISVTCLPYRPFGDAIMGIIINGRDTTELKNISDKHKIQKAYFENLFQQSPDAIAILDNNDRVVNVNDAFTELFGYTLRESLGKPINSLVVPDDLKKEGLEATMSVASGQNISLETVRKTKSGKLIHVSIIGKPILMENNQLAVYGIYRDITRRKKTEEKIARDLKEKEVLLKEIHHRVKNNMQIISSLLNMQIRYVKDEADKEIFRESQNRIKSMALIHERLYKSDDLTHISFEEYTRKVVSYLLASYESGPKNIDFIFDIEDVAIPINQAIPLGLIVNEIISNSLKYAFKDTPKPVIHITLHKIDSRFEMIIQDNGCGLDLSKKPEESKTMGIHLIKTLTAQLHGTLDMESDQGLAYTIHW